MEAHAELKSILDRLATQPDDAVRREAAEFLARHDDRELVELEEALVSAGMPRERTRNLCASHLARARAQEGLRPKLPEGHVLATLMDEHQRILGRLARLEELAAPVELTAEGREQRLTEMRDLAAHLVGAEPHHQREEQVLFPALIERGIAGPPAVMEAEHVEIRELKHGVRDGAANMLAESDELWPTLREHALHLAVTLGDHIAKEDNVLYPMAFEVIGEPEAWADMKRRCDEIGYCCGN